MSDVVEYSCVHLLLLLLCNTMIIRGHNRWRSCSRSHLRGGWSTASWRRSLATSAGAIDTIWYFMTEEQSVWALINTPQVYSQVYRFLTQTNRRIVFCRFCVFFFFLHMAFFLLCFFCFFCFWLFWFCNIFLCWFVNKNKWAKFGLNNNTFPRSNILGGTIQNCDSILTTTIRREVPWYDTKSWALFSNPI